MKILVTGSSGFIGNALSIVLKKNNYDIIELNSKNSDILNDEFWDTIPHCEIVIHLAGKTFVPDSWINPTSFIEVNSYGTLKVLEYCRKNKSKIIYISSYLYGNAKIFPINETAEIYTPNPYALSKKIAEEFCIFYANSFSINYVILRPFNVYGPGQNSNFIIPEVINQIFNQKKIYVKDLSPKRDYIYIDDFINAIVNCISIINNDIINIGSGVSYSVSEIINEIQNIIGTNYAVICQNNKRQDEIMDTIADISKAKNILKWEPKITLKEGLKNVIEKFILY